MKEVPGVFIKYATLQSECPENMQLFPLPKKPQDQKNLIQEIIRGASLQKQWKEEIFAEREKVLIYSRKINLIKQYVGSEIQAREAIRKVMEKAFNLTSSQSKELHEAIGNFKSLFYLDYSDLRTKLTNSFSDDKIRDILNSLSG